MFLSRWKLRLGPRPNPDTTAPRSAQQNGPDRPCAIRAVLLGGTCLVDLLDRALQLRTGAEHRALASLDGHLFAGLRIAALTGGTLNDLE